MTLFKENLDYNYSTSQQPIIERNPPVKRKRFGIWLNILLFILTFIFVVMAGVQWLERDPFEIGNFSFGLTYGILIITFLSLHEFGHYFAAKYHKVQVTLPYYIPFPPFLLNPFGTMGAVIRMKEHIKSRRALFDIGIAGPVAGFIAAAAMLIYGMTHLPPFEYIYSIHPEYQGTGVPMTGFSFGPNLLFITFAKIFTSSPDVFLPPMNEIYHYPFLCVGWFGLFVTSMNLLPVGQFDGGHIIYALFGSMHKFITRTFFGITLGLGLVGLMQQLGINIIPDYSLFHWFIWALLMFFVIRIDHPPFVDPEPIGTGRKLWGVFALFMFVSSFTPVPFMGL